MSEPRRLIYWLSRPYAIATFALLLRLTYVLHSWPIDPWNNHWAFGFEMGRIARSMVEGRGYADPFDGHTGPTGWIAPLYPLLMAAVFKMSGVYTSASERVLLDVNCVLSALMVLPVYGIARRCVGERRAIAAAWVWALYLPLVKFSVHWIWETPLSGLLFACVFLLALKMRRVGEGEGGTRLDAPGMLRRNGEGGVQVVAPRMGEWALFAVMWGVIAMSNPSLLIFLPACGVWVLWGAADVRREIWKAVVAGVIFLACLAPWTARNWRVMHAFVPLRTDFGAELYFTNGPGANGLIMRYRHPSVNQHEYEDYARMGEIAYARDRRAKAIAEIERNPLRFVKNCATRFEIYWFSPRDSEEISAKRAALDTLFAFANLCGWMGLTLALRRRMPGAWLMLWAFVLLPLVPYVVTVHERFTYPLDALIAILAVYLFASSVSRPGWSLRNRRG